MCMCSLILLKGEVRTIFFLNITHDKDWLILNESFEIKLINDEIKEFLKKKTMNSKFLSYLNITKNI